MSGDSHDSVALGAAEAVNIDTLHAGTLSLEASAAQAVQAESVVTHLSAIAQAQIGTAAIQSSAIGNLQSDHADLHSSAVALVQADSLSLRRSAAWLVQSDSAQVQERSIVGLLIARQTTGEVRPLLDWRGAALLGIVIGLVLRLTTRRH
ncbi:MAG: hypothetical protein JW910_07650 [Anaerolineae bacterium]|nr:hypothetical protein [Anaerolineae bacterium]